MNQTFEATPFSPPSKGSEKCSAAGYCPTQVLQLRHNAAPPMPQMAPYYQFEFRMYTLKELGALYYPWRKAYGSASKALSQLIRSDGELLARLKAIGYRKGMHNLSPAMVKLLVEYLGTPEEFSSINYARRD